MPTFVLPFPLINPILFQWGPLAIRWYALAYIVGLIAGWALLRRVVADDSLWGGATRPSRDSIDDLLVYCALGVVIGGRLGNVLFYDPGYYFSHPWEILKVWKGGMAFHGGLLGVIGAMTLFAWRRHRSPADVYDFTSPLPALGLFFGRIGNFINGELWGKVTTVPWGFKVNGEVRHASQLYEATLEGLLLFIILWWFTSSPRPRLAPSGLFLLLYGLARSLVEFVRVPDEHIGYLAGGWLTEGQILSLPMIIAGIALLVWAYRARVPSGNYAMAR